MTEVLIIKPAIGLIFPICGGIERFGIEAISLILRAGSESDGCQNGCQQQHIEFAGHARGSVRTSDTLSSP